MTASGAGWRWLAFVLAAASLTLTLTVSANLLFVLGIDYAHPGGNPLVKLHPATWAVGAALACALLAAPDPVRALCRSLERRPALSGFLALMTVVMLYSAVSVGVSGVAVYVESYLSAGLLALVLSGFTAGQRRALGLLVLGLLALNAGLAAVETLGQFHLVPIYLEETALLDEPGAFRSSALFDHPLTGAMLTMTGLFTALSLRLAPTLLIPLMGVFGVALLAFGGRAALAVTVIALGLALGRSVLRDLMRRRLRAGRMLWLVAGAILVPAGAGVLVTSTGIGGRISGKLYLDSSAQSRGGEWRVLGLLDWRAWLFGSPIAETPGLIYRVGLHTALTDIENFWLLALVNLGVVGFVVFVAAIACLLRHLWRVGAPFGRVAVVALMLTASTSNSLGRKSNVLFVLVACVEAASIAPVRARWAGAVAVRQGLSVPA